jgi:hypothetical protein
MKLEIRHWSEHLPNKPLFGFHSRAEMVKILNCTDLYVHPEPHRHRTLERP